MTMTIRIERLARVLLNLAVVAYLLPAYSRHGIGFSPYRIDLDVYRIGGQVWLHGRNLYGVIPPTRIGVRLPFSYPPIAAVLLSPLALIPMWAAVVLLMLATIALVVLVLRIFLSAAGWERPARAVWWLLPAVLMLEPVRNTLLYGQVNVALMALVSADCLTPSPRWPRGVLTGIAAAVKLTPAVFVLFFLLRRDRRAAMMAGLAFLACTGTGFLVAWRDSVEYWTSVIFQSGRPGPPVYTANQSILAVIARAGLDPHSLAGAATWAVLSVTVVVVACLGMRRAFAASQPAWALSLNAFAGLLISPISWSHHWVWGEMAVLTLAIGSWRGRNQAGLLSKTGLALAAVGTLLFALSPQWWLPNGANRELHWVVWEQMLGSSYVIYAVIVLLAALVLTPADQTQQAPLTVKDTVMSSATDPRSPPVCRAHPRTSGFTYS